MFITITFKVPVSAGRVLSDLRNVKKNYKPFRSCICQVDENSGLFSIQGEDGSLVAQCHFQISSNEVSFTLFKGKEKDELFKMLKFRLVEDISVSAYINTDGITLFYDLQGFKFEADGKYYLLGDDYEKAIQMTELYRVPQEIRKEQGDIISKK